MKYLSTFAEFYQNNDYSMPIQQSGVTTLDAGALAAIILFSIFFAIIAYAIYAVLLGMLFKKAGVPQWVAWVPFYNVWRFLEIGGQPGFWAVLSIISPLNIVTAVFIYISSYHIGLKLGKESWWVIIAIFFPVIWLAILAFDSSKWQGPLPASKPSEK